MDFSNSKIEYLIVHEIGNKLRYEKAFLSSTIQEIDEHLEKDESRTFSQALLALYQILRAEKISISRWPKFVDLIVGDIAAKKESFINSPSVFTSKLSIFWRNSQWREN